MLNTFQMFCKPFKDGEGGPKLDAIINFIDDSISKEWVPGLGLIVNKQDNPKKIIVSHMDLIKKFRKGFANENTFSQTDTEVTGALDNTITNAVLAHIINDLGNINGIEYVFTEGEEVGFHGMEKYIKVHGEKIKDSFFINLDVTNEGYHKHISVEYDVPNFSVLKQIQSLIGDHSHFTGNRVCDDTDAIIDANLHGLSICLPTKNTIHSYENTCKKESIEIFKEGLKALILDESIDYNGLSSDIKRYQLSDALKCESKDDLPKQAQKQKQSYSYYDYDDSDYPWVDTDYSEERRSYSLPTKKESRIDISLATFTSFLINSIKSYNTLMSGDRMAILTNAESALDSGVFSSIDFEELDESDFEKIVLFLVEHGYVRTLFGAVDFNIADKNDVWIGEFSFLPSVKDKFLKVTKEYRQLSVFLQKRIEKDFVMLSIEEINHEVLDCDPTLSWFHEAINEGLIDDIGGGDYYINRKRS